MTSIKAPPQTTRRRILKTLAGAGIASAFGSHWVPSAFAQSGQGYELLQPPMPVGDASKVEVLEFFWFGCPHCYAFEPAINKWDNSKPDYVNFVREAPPLNPSWEQHSRAFYASEALNLTTGFFDAMFDHIHKDRKPARSAKQIGQFVESLDLGVSSADFQKAMKSFAVETAIKRSLVRARQAGITGVPSIVVNGKYRTGNSIAGSHEAIISVIDELVEFEHTA